MNEKGKDKNVSNSQIVAETATLKCLKQNNKYKLSDKSSNTTELENYHDKPNYLDPFNIGSTTSIQKDSYSYQAENILDEIVEESIKKIQQDTMTTHNDFYPPITDFYSMVSPQHIPENVPSPSEKLKKLSLYCNESDFELNINNNFFEKVNEPNINRVSGEKYDSLSFEDGFSKKVYS